MDDETPILSPRRILVVDDEPYIRESVLDIIDTTDHEAEDASDGQEGLERLQEKTFDLMIVDLKMPRMDGATLIEELRKFNDDLAIIVFTGHGELQDAYFLLRNHQISDFIQKPLDSPGMLLFSIENALEKQQYRRDIQTHRDQLKKANIELENKNVELAQANAQLKQARKELEDRIRERVEDLKKAKARLQKIIRERQEAETELTIVNEELANISDLLDQATASH